MSVIAEASDEGNQRTIGDGGSLGTTVINRTGSKRYAMKIVSNRFAMVCLIASDKRIMVYSGESKDQYM